VRSYVVIFIQILDKF